CRRPRRRRLGAGRLSEVVGPATLSLDVEMRLLGLDRQAEAQLAAAPPEMVALCDAYSAGVNAFLQQGRTLPPEFQLLGYRPQPWQPADALIWGRVMAWSLSENWRDEVRRQRLARLLPADQLELLWPALTGEAPRAALRQPRATQLAAEPSPSPFAPALRGLSNNWVVAGSRAASGKPLLADDPHLELRTPSQWYLVRIETPALRLVGATAPGTPF